MSYLAHFSTERAERIYNTAMERLKKQKYYRQRGLTARSLAADIGVDPRSLSAAISIYTNSSFPAILSELRLRKSCSMLRAPRYAGLSAEEIGIRSGFASRQAFYSAFSKAMGTTPCKYRQACTEKRLAEQQADAAQP